MLLLGTRNPKKREEIVEILGDLGLEFGDLSDRPDVADVEETGTTLRGKRPAQGTRLRASRRRMDAWPRTAGWSFPP